MRGNSPSGIDAGKESDCSRPEGFYARLIKKPLPEFCYFFANFFTQEGTKTGKFFSGLFARACVAAGKHDRSEPGVKAPRLNALATSANTWFQMSGLQESWPACRLTLIAVRPHRTEWLFAQQPHQRCWTWSSVP